MDEQKIGNMLGLLGIIALPVMVGLGLYMSYKQGKEPVPLLDWKKVDKETMGGCNGNGQRND